MWILTECTDTPDTEFASSTVSSLPEMLLSPIWPSHCLFCMCRIYSSPIPSQGKQVLGLEHCVGCSQRLTSAKDSHSLQALLKIKGERLFPLFILHWSVFSYTDYSLCQLTLVFMKHISTYNKEALHNTEITLGKDDAYFKYLNTYF